MNKRVAVIGAGLSGLVTVKELLEAGHEPVCYERAEGLGGVFRFNENDGVIWESCRLTSSGYLTAFSDFPVSSARAEHMHASEYVHYLEEYCQQYEVLPHIRFGQGVEAVRRLEDGRWKITSTGNDECMREEIFDAVAVCSGLHQHSHIPDIPGLESFPGEAIHAAQYRGVKQAKGKKVLVVGAGESGADIAAEMAKEATEAVISLRRGVAVVSRMIHGQPRDYLTSRLMNGAAHWVFQTRNPKDNHLRNIYRILGLPIVVLDKFLDIFLRQAWGTVPILLSGSLSDIKLKLLTRQVTLQLLAESGGTINEQFGTKDDAFVRALARGKLKRVSGVEQIEGRSFYFADGSTFEPDLVIFCTGFETRMPFIEEPVAERDRYLNTFDPDLGVSIAFIGFVRPSFGAIPPLAELQARWFAKLVSGEGKLPDTEEMHESIDSWNRRRRHMFRAKEDRLNHLVDFTEYCDLLAEQVGCKPGKKAIARESIRFRRRYLSGPFVAAQYRLTGPGAKPQIAREVIEGLPLAHPWPEWVNLHLRWRLCRFLERVLGPEYAPKLSNRS